MRLKLERFGLPNKPSETPAQLEEPVRCGDWGRAPALPLAPNPEATPQSGSTPDSSPYTGEPGKPLRRCAPAPLKGSL